MIERVTGQVAKLEKEALVVMVGGVGLYMRATKAALETVAVGQAVMLFTRLIVREDDLSLFAFASEEERATFEALINVSGVGARTALTMLSVLTTEQIRAAVRRDDAQILTRVPGIGKKTAEKIVFELKGKIGTDADALSQLAAIDDTDAEVIAALTALGYSIVEAQAAVQNIPRDASKDVATRVLIALQSFG
jgi:Holliday junction DNA helicase RuvA